MSSELVNNSEWKQWRDCSVV